MKDANRRPYELDELYTDSKSALKQTWSQCTALRTVASPPAPFDKLRAGSLSYKERGA